MGKLSNKPLKHRDRSVAQRGRLREKFRAAKISYTKREMTEFSFRMFIEAMGELRLANDIDKHNEELESVFPEPMEMDV